MLRRIPLLLLLLIGVAAQTAASPIDSVAALRLAQAFFESRCSEGTLAFSQHDVSGQLSLKRQPRGFMVESASQFVLIGTDDASPAVLGYGQKSRHGSVALPPALQAMLSSAPTYAPAYDLAPKGTVSPLLTTIRHQYAPYNRYCPVYRYDNGSTAPCLVGCVATAMEQVITYHRPFITLLDTLRACATEHYEAPAVLPGSCLDTRLIRNDYDNEACSDAEIDAVARLSYWLGLAARMQWSPAASGAYSAILVGPLRTAFGFPYVHYLEKRKYDPQLFWQFIVQEIQAHRPVYYAGAIMQTGGHAFVLDGLDADGLFHVNWGYGGDFDGYFRLDVLSYAQPPAERKDHPVDDGFLADQEAIVLGTQPVAAILPDTLQRFPDDVTISRIECLLPPATNRLTPVQLHVRNTSASQAFYTTLGLMEMPASAGTTEEAQSAWLALTACQLGPLEEKVITVHAQFSFTGQAVLAVTPDGDHITASVPVDVKAGGTQAFLTTVPQVDVMSSTEVCISQTIGNASRTERAAQRFLYDLLDENTQTSVRTTHTLYLDAGETVIDTIRFSALTPGHHYTLRLRERWPIVQQVSFTLPVADGIVSPAGDKVLPHDLQWYGIDGRRLSVPPHKPGVYLTKQGPKTRKVRIK